MTTLTRGGGKQRFACMRDWLASLFPSYVACSYANLLQSMQILLLCIFLSPTLVFEVALHTPNKQEGREY
jgi:maltodextrin utilization protein YvdJ